jgi:group I intron endonuclease
MGCVYVWTNTLNGKQYVGMSVEPEVRRRNHLYSARSGSGYFFHNAVRKYGEEAFTYEEIFWSDDDAELKAIEIAEIARRGTFGGGYNLTPGGDGITKLTCESEARRVASSNRPPRHMIAL